MSFYTILTNIGAAALANAQAGNTVLELTHIALGDGNGVPVNPIQTAIALAREVHRVPITSITQDITNPNWLRVEAVVISTIGGWTIREIGLIGGEDKLIAIGNFPETYKPVVETENASRDLTIRMVIEVSSAAVVSLTVDPSVAVATNQAIVNAVAAHVAAVDPHPQYMKAAQRGAANGVAPLGADNLVPLANLPPAIATDAELAASLSAHVDPLTDPHPQYMTSLETMTVISAALATTGIKYIEADAVLTVRSRYLANAATPGIVWTLPEAPVKGDAIAFQDAGATWGANLPTLARNGQTIEGLAEDLTINVSDSTFSIWFNGTTWRLI
jgi:phage-related tail fiber protein